MRKFLAGRLIRLAHRIYPPRVTDCSLHMSGVVELADLIAAHDRRKHCQGHLA